MESYLDHNYNLSIFHEEDTNYWQYMRQVEALEFSYGSDLLIIMKTPDGEFYSCISRRLNRILDCMS